MPSVRAPLSTSSALTAAGTFSAARSCAAALDPIASMNRPMIAAAARPPKNFTTMFVALVLAGEPAGGALRSALSFQREIARLARSPAFQSPVGLVRSQLLKPRYVMVARLQGHGGELCDSRDGIRNTFKSFSFLGLSTAGKPLHRRFHSARRQGNDEGLERGHFAWRTG